MLRGWKEGYSGRRKLVHLSDRKSIWETGAWFPVLHALLYQHLFQTLRTPLSHKCDSVFKTIFLCSKETSLLTSYWDLSLHIQSPLSPCSDSDMDIQRDGGRGEASSRDSVTTNAIYKPCPLHFEIFPCPQGRKCYGFQKIWKTKAKLKTKQNLVKAIICAMASPN